MSREISYLKSRYTEDGQNRQEFYMTLTVAVDTISESVLDAVCCTRLHNQLPLIGRKRFFPLLCQTGALAFGLPVVW